MSVRLGISARRRLPRRAGPAQPPRRPPRSSFRAPSPLSRIVALSIEPGRALGALAGIQDRNANESTSSIPHHHPVLGDVTIRRYLGTLEAHIEHIRFLVEVEPDILRRQIEEMR